MPSARRAGYSDVILRANEVGGRTAALAASAAPWERQQLGTVPRRAHLLSGDDPHELINRVDFMHRLALQSCGVAPCR